ncbi:MAG TPA: thiamine pyrophosphate-dependent enzyme [Fimbriimonadaceae bacterium]|nr:thiamine pyrophosphate-dependent enzyme [Fimbriimonadaceae bacterium]
MARNASDILIDSIIDWGVDVVFGLPGDGINGIMEALRTRKDKIRFVQTRHEEAAAFMACGYAKYTGRLGCCLATSGPGAIHLLNGLYDAKMDQAPVLAITGQTFSDLKGSNFQQEVNTLSLYEDVTVYNQEVINPGQIEMLADEACRHALNDRGVAHISFPVDYQEEEPSSNGSMHKVRHATDSRWTPSLAIPREHELKRAAELLNMAKAPVLLVGSGALRAGMEVAEVAETLAAPVVKALLGKAVLPDTHPNCLGGLGLLGTTPSQIAMENCDAILMIGTSFPYMEFLPKHEQAIGIQIDDKADRIGLRFAVDVGLVGDARMTLRALIPLLARKADRSFLEQMQSHMKDWREVMETRARHETPIKPQQIARDLNELASDDAILSTDSGTITTWAARQFDIHGSRMFSCSGNLATMAPGLPYAIAAAVAYPERQSIAFVGDGGFTMLMGEFATAVKYDLPITVVIVKNNTLGQIKWEQIVFLGNPEYGVDLQPIDFAKFAEACGGIGLAVKEPGDVRAALRTALESRRPCIVEVEVDPCEPPMPSSVSLRQAEHFAEALVKGEPNRGKIALTLFRDKLSELV